MFENHTCNITPIESYMRIGLAVILLFLAVYTSCYLLIIISILLYYTGIKKFCFVYYFFKINERFSKDNYYLSFLPKYNPSSVFIFDVKGKLVFKNKAATNEFAEALTTKCIGIEEHYKIIENGLFQTIMLEHKGKHYQIGLQGLNEEKLLLTYLTDVTKIVELNEAIEETQREVIYTMGEIGETRSKETGNHVKRVATYSKLLALLYGLSKEEAETLKMASPMHDIGKVGIPDAVLNAPRKLDLDEWKIMQTHAQLGYDMLKNSKKPILKAAAIVAHEHHEKWMVQAIQTQLLVKIYISMVVSLL